MVDPMSLTLTNARVLRGGKTILDADHYSLDAEGFSIVLGPNGSGKTTFLKVLHGVARLSEGERHWSCPEEEAIQHQAYVFQTPTMLRRSVRQNLAYPLKLLGLPKIEVSERVEKWARRIGLQGALDRPAPRLSGGEKQKLALGRALIRNPKVLFLDEPCANLDGRSTREIETLLANAHSKGTRMVMATHDIGQARRLASDLIFMLNGKIHEVGSAGEIFTDAKQPQTRAFLDGDIVE